MQPTHLSQPEGAARSTGTPKTVAQERYEYLGRELLSYIGLERPHRIRKSYSGRVELRSGRLWVEAPWPTCGWRKLYILAHEVAHCVLHVESMRAGKPESGDEELEAELWAIKWLSRRGVVVPPEERQRARDYVKLCYERQLQRELSERLAHIGERVDSRIRLEP